MSVTESPSPAMIDAIVVDIFELLWGTERAAIPTAVDHAYESIWRQLIAGERRPGERLSDVELSAQLGVSRTPVRQALHRLAQDELVRFDPRRGFWVRVFTAHDIHEMFDVRASLEALAVRLAGPRLKRDDLLSHLEQLHACRARLPERPVAAFLRHDFQLHNLLIHASENGRLIRILAALRSQVSLFQIRDTSYPHRLERSLDGHELVLRALLAGQTENAANLMSEHIASARDGVLADLFGEREEETKKHAPTTPDGNGAKLAGLLRPTHAGNGRYRQARAHDAPEGAMTAKPTPGQLRWQDLQFGMFCHFGINTYYRKEWSDGTLDPAAFAPRRLDARQWVETAQAAGIRYLILTAKHHDGFCLWPTATTDYSVRSSPYKGGQGDVVGEVAAACRELGMPLGLYLSPWDRNAPCYADPAAYDEFYVRQLTELCTRYGPLVELWFDGAGSAGRTYDWDAIMAVIDRHQPEAMVFHMGRSTIRWVGNEDGLATDPCHYVVSSTPGTAAYTDDYLAAAPRYLPPECDVSIRQGWFWHPEQLPTLKRRDHLLGIYYRSVGRGANLLLNVPPNRDGLIDEADRSRLLELAGELQRRFADPIPGQVRYEDETALIDFGGVVEFDHLLLREDLAHGQLIDGYRVLVEPDGREILRGGTVGSQKIDVVAATRARSLRIDLGNTGARLRDVTAYRTGHEVSPTWEEPAEDPAREIRID